MMEKDTSEMDVMTRNSEAASDVDYVDYVPSDLFGGKD